MVVDIGVQDYTINSKINKQSRCVLKWRYSKIMVSECLFGAWSVMLI